MTDNSDTSAPTAELPLLYKSLSPLASSLHADCGLVLRDSYPEAKNTHLVPLTVDEFTLAQKHYPIIFSLGETSTPMALLSLQEGKNDFLDKNNKWRQDAYVPAYIRRYPFLLARLTPEAKELSLCFDDQSGLVAKNKGEGLFTDGKPSETTKAILGFCEEFENAVVRTRTFMAELEKTDLLLEGEFNVQVEGEDKPITYRGFKIIGEKPLQELRGDQARKLVSNGMLGLIYAHLFSLANVRALFAWQKMGAAPTEIKKK